LESALRSWQYVRAARRSRQTTNKIDFILSKGSAAGSLIVVAAVLLIYTGSTRAYFFDDDFHWLASAPGFSVPGFFDLSRYNHFYRPVIETYFFIGWKLFGCDPLPFHVASIAIHLLTTGAVFAFAFAVSRSRVFAGLSALFFAVQPGLTDAVTWIGAITDQLPALWYVVAVWAHLRFLAARRPVLYALTLTVFVLCLLTHESSATLLPMMALAALVFVASGSLMARVAALVRAWLVYLPYAVLLIGYLAIEWIVNTRSYVVQDGHYALGWHAVPNILNYVIWLYVGERAALDYVLLVAALVAIVVRGTPRMCFALLWIVVTLLPVAFFTWDNAPRYLYLPAVGFAMLVADLMLAAYALAARWMTVRAAGVAASVLVAALAIRFGIFAKKAADSFPGRAAHYERYATELRRANANVAPRGTVEIDAQYLEGIPELYREPAASVAFCVPDLRVRIR
jgi:hypothetical protein